MLTTVVVPLLVYWVILFVACFITVEFAQNYLYDETTPAVGVKVLVGTLIFAALLTWARTRFDTLLTADLAWTLLQAIVWFAVFTLIFRFQPLHAFSIGVIAFLILSGTASLAVDSLTGTSPSGVPATRRPAQPTRRPIGTTLKPVEAEKGEAADAKAGGESAKPAGAAK